MALFVRGSSRAIVDLDVVRILLQMRDRVAGGRILAGASEGALSASHAFEQRLESGV